MTAHPLCVLVAAAAVSLAAAPAADARDRLFPRLGSGGYDAVHYSVVQRYDPASDRLRGSTTMTARATRAARTVSLDFQGLEVTRVAVDGRRARFRHRGAKLVVTPRRALDARRTFRVAVSYAGVPNPIVDADGSREGWIATEDGAYVVGQPTGSQTWFPSNNTPRDKARFDVRTTVPRGTTVVGNGVLVATRRRSATVTWHWRERRPMATYLATATLGRFEITRARANGITFFDAVDPGLSGDDQAAARAALGRQPAIVESYAALYGAYPFDYVGGAVDRAGAVGYALESQSISNYHQPPTREVIAHEVGHQWFGNSVTPREWSDVWLNEGFATWAQWEWSHRADGDPLSPAQRFDANYSRDAADRFWQVPPGRPRASELFHQATYVRGAMTLEGLRQIAGDATFFRILRRWAADNRYGSVTTADFIALAERESGRDLGAYFRDWLYAPRKPAKRPAEY